MLWQRRQWRYLLNLIDRLPPNSHTHTALVNDEEYAEMVLDARDKAAKAGKAPSKAPHGAWWSVEAGLLASVNDRLAVLIESNRTNPKQPVQYPRPSTAFDRVEYRRRQKAHENLVARVLRKPPQE